MGGPKKVCFESIEIYEHAYEMGDNPSVSQGAPLTISWKQQDVTMIDLECYEQSRPKRKSGNKLKLSVSARVKLLLSSGYSMEDIVTCALTVHEDKQNREESIRKQKWDGLQFAIMDRVKGTFKKVARRGSLLASAASSSSPFKQQQQPSQRRKSALTHQSPMQYGRSLEESCRSDSSFVVCNNNNNNEEEEDVEGTKDNYKPRRHSMMASVMRDSNLDANIVPARTA